MSTIGFIGNWGDIDSIGGQITKTKELIKAILKRKGYREEVLFENVEKASKNIYLINVAKERNPFILFFRVFNMLRRADSIVIVLASKGYFRLLPFVMLINHLYKKKIYEFVIGGIRYEFLNHRRIVLERKIEKIYVESTYMVEKYNALGLYNVEYMPNFKDFNAISKSEIEKKRDSIVRICTFSRIDEFKGIDSAIDIVKKATNINSNILLDIIGPVDAGYKKTFDCLLRNAGNNIHYIGVIDGNNTIEYLKKYDILLFPTRWKAEGLPGSFIDAMAAGLIIIASDRMNYRDVIKNNINGFLFDENDRFKFTEVIVELSKDESKLRELRINSMYESNKYQSDIVLRRFYEEIR